MNPPTPHYLLFAEATDADGDGGRWRFLLRASDGSDHVEATDVEPDVRGERLALLTVVRALEALDQPSKVTLVGCSSTVRQGLEYGLPQWRNNGWRWEYFGQMVPVRNGDLWQRMDRALEFHRVECRQRRFDPAEQRAAYPGAGAENRELATAAAAEPAHLGGRLAAARRVGYWIRARWTDLRRRTAAIALRWRRAAAEPQALPENTATCG